MSTYADLLAQKRALDKQIEIARQAEATRALESVRELVQEFGFTAQQVFPWTTKVNRPGLSRHF
jgi:DNA-binding protein H-NS